MGYKIAIDGPSASGKSTLAKALAKKLNFKHIDTGLMFRLVTYLALQTKKDLESIDTYDFLDNIEFDIKDEKLYYNGNDITNLVRTPIIDKNISIVSSLPFVRDKLLKVQRQYAETQNVIMDGRDIATVVLPNAEIKIFLTASIDIRAKRRYLENEEKHIKDNNINDVKDSLIIRDYKDINRKVAPLKQDKDAICFDTTNLTTEQLAQDIYILVKEKLNL